jgi:tRNA (guanosine-2'-O-)-methyltransferase
MFPFSQRLQVDDQASCSYEEVLKWVYPLLTQERQDRIEKVVKNRIFRHAVVLENIYDRGNTSAVLRSAEAFGLANIHIIETFEKFKESQRTTAGADKWLEVKKWKSTKDFIQQIKSQGKKIAVTYLDSSSQPLGDLNFQEDIALVLGNEKDGVSTEMLAAADYKVIIPMVGFVQSFNISVAGALCFYEMWKTTTQAGVKTELQGQSLEILKAVYAMRTLDTAGDIIKKMRNET